MAKINFSILIWLLFTASVVYAQRTGRIADTDGIPVKGALITFRDMNDPDILYMSRTDENGVYTLNPSTDVDRTAYQDKPNTIILLQNFPNPFNPVTTIPLSLDRETDIRLNIYNVLGQHIKTLFNGRKSSGYHRITWDGNDDRGGAAGAGIYLYLLEADGSRYIRKMLLLDGGAGNAHGYGMSEDIHSGNHGGIPSARKQTSITGTFTVSIIGENLYRFEQKGLEITDDSLPDFIVRRAAVSQYFIPGAVFREFAWRGPFRNASNWQRVTDPDATASGAKEFLPNPVNTITLDDLDDAIAVEAQIELLQCHAGTYNKRIRFNGGDWHRIPEAGGISETNPECYQTITYPVIGIPVDELVDGINTFELTNDGQTCFNFGWGQFIIYGVTFRVYYNDPKPHPTGRIVSPATGETIDDNPVLTVEPESPDTIRRVSFIGCYEDFNYEGDNNWLRWHYASRYGKMLHHIGNADSAPYSMIWDTTWLPDQELPLKFMALIADSTGMCHLTPAVTDIEFHRTGRSVKMYKPYNVPTQWVSRTGQYKSCRVDVYDDLSAAVESQLLIMSWAGTYAEEIKFNGQKVAGPIGRSYDYSFNTIAVDPGLIVNGTNSILTNSWTSGHGIEVQWPGIVLKTEFK